MEYQQNLAMLPVAILIVLARSNRMEHMELAIPAILQALDELQPQDAAEDCCVILSRV